MRSTRTKTPLPSTVLTALIVITLILIGNAFAIQVIDSHKLSHEANAQSVRHTTLFGKRGAILDRDGQPLVLTKHRANLTFQPKAAKSIITSPNPSPEYLTCGTKHKITTYPAYRDTLIHYLTHQAEGITIPEGSLDGKLDADTEFTYLAKNIDPFVAKNIHTTCPLIGVEKSVERVYINGALATNILGFSTPTEGLSGLELTYNSLLHATNGREDVHVGANGQPLPFNTVVQPSEDGHNIATTLDATLQTILQTEVEATTASTRSRSGHAIIMDGWTGDILALADSGTFDPDLDIASQPASSFTAQSVTSPFEPGSTAKLVTFVAALDKGLIKPSTTFTVPGDITLDSLTVHDAWEHGPILWTAEDIFAQSSNVGTLLIAKKLGRHKYWDTFKHFPFGIPTHAGIPGESAGIVTPLGKWQPGSFANFPIGQGFSVNLIQLASMYQPIVNKGVTVRPRLVIGYNRDGRWVNNISSTDPGPTPTQVMKPSTATIMLKLMHRVFTHPQGTASTLNIPGLYCAGKTGTAQQVDPSTGQYSSSLHWSTFAGILPDSFTNKPRYVFATMLDNPVTNQAAIMYNHIATYFIINGIDSPRLVNEPGLQDFKIEYSANNKMDYPKEKRS